MKPESRRWIDAGIRLSEDPSALVPCPVCRHEFLEVTDADSPSTADSDGAAFDRYLRCAACGAVEVMVRMRR